MPIVDWVFAGVLGLSMLLGLWRGLVREVISAVSWMAAFVVAQWFAPEVAQWLPMSGASEVIRYAAGFVVVFIAVVFTGGVIAFVAGKMVSAVGLGLADRFLGAGFGLVRGAMVLLVATMLVGMTPLRSSDGWAVAGGPRIAGNVLQGIKPVLPAEFGKYLPS
jgi:membrane protein required for colicin V production